MGGGALSAETATPGHPGIAIKIRDHRYPVEMHELTEQLPRSRDEILAWRYHTHLGPDGHLSQTPPGSMRRERPTGRLRLALPNGYRGGRSSWCDGPRGLLESKLGSIFRTLERRADADDVAATERARRFAELQHEQAARDERVRRERIETARLERLLAEVATWRRSEEIRAYVAALAERLPVLGSRRATPHRSVVQMGQRTCRPHRPDQANLADCRAGRRVTGCAADGYSAPGRSGAADSPDVLPERQRHQLGILAPAARSGGTSSSSECPRGPSIPGARRISAGATCACRRCGAGRGSAQAGAPRAGAPPRSAC